MKICVLVIATNKYINFIQTLLDSIENNFLTDHDISCLLFTDNEIEEVSDNVKISKIEHESWPGITLKRFHYFLKERQYISQFDYCFYIDADMRVVGKVGDEILGDLVGTIHPGRFHQEPDEYNYERNEKSTAYVPFGGGSKYYIGSFNGGKPEHFLKMSEVLSKNIDIDLENGIIAVWHDESHMNRYFIDNPPDIELSPSYSYPEAVINNPTWAGGHVKKYEPLIFALDKNHSKLRL